MTPNASRTLACARHLHMLGLTPLPSRHDVKAPDLKSFTHFYDGEPVPGSVYDEWKSCNMQVITGTNHPGERSVVVIDLDGDAANDTWYRICQHHGYRPTSTWMVETGSGGTHIWYSLPQNVRECPSGMIWGMYDTFGESGEGSWLKHWEIRILGDRALAMSPPSFHPETGRRYKFLPNACPNTIGWPEPIPTWLLAMPRLVTPSFTSPSSVPIMRGPERLSGRHYMRNEVLTAIGDNKVSLAREWGLRFERETPNPAGWISCYVPWREEPGKSRPSGTMHCLDGTFQDRKDNKSISFFDLGALLQPNAFKDWIACRDYCGDRFIGRIIR